MSLIVRSMRTKRPSSGARPERHSLSTLMRSTSIRRGSARFATDSVMSDARRSEVWLLDFGEPLGNEQGWQRPALIVSSDEWNRHASVVTVLPLTRTKHDLPTRVEIEADPRNGLADTSYARCEDIRSVSERRLVRRVGGVDLRVMHSLSRVIRTFLEL